MNLTAVLLAVLLGSPQHTTRHAAESALERLGPIAAPALAWASQSGDPERASRAARLLDPFTIQPWPYIDGLPYDVLGRVELIHNFVRLATAEGVPLQSGCDWPAYRRAAQLW